MQIGIRFHDTEKLPFEQRLARIREQGFSCIHLALSKVQDLPSDPEMLTPGYAMWLRHQFAQNDLDVAVLGCYLNLGNPNQKQLSHTQEIYMAQIRFAAALGCSVVGTETGSTNEDYHYDPQACCSEQALLTLIQNLRPVVQYAEKMGVLLAIEPVWRHIVSDADRARRVLDTICSPNLRIILDPVNLISPQKYEQRDETIAHAIEVLGEDVAIIHLKDCRQLPGEVGSYACGTGDMDYTQIIHFAETRKPYIQATLENTTPENAVQTRQLIQNMIEKEHFIKQQAGNMEQNR